MQRIQRVTCGDVDLAYHQDIGHRHLILRGIVLAEGGQAMLAVDHADHGVKLVGGHDRGVGHHGVHQRHGIGKAGGFDYHTTEGWDLLQIAAPIQIAQGHHQIAAYGAAQAAIAQFKDVLGQIRHHQMIDADFAEFVDDDSGVFESALRQQPRQERGLAAAQEAGQQCDRGLAFHDDLLNSPLVLSCIAHRCARR